MTRPRCGYGKWTKKELRSLFIFVVLVVNGAWVALAQRWVDGTCFLTGLAYFVGYYNGVKVVSSIVFFARPFMLHAWRVMREACHGFRERRAAETDPDEVAAAATPVAVAATDKALSLATASGGVVTAENAGAAQEHVVPIARPSPQPISKS